MNPAVVLLILRIVSALILLGFLGLIAWLIYKDLKTTSALLSEGQRVRGTLTVTRAGSESGTAPAQHPLMPVTSIGRAKSNTLVIEDEYASSRHALLSLRGQQWWLEDLESRNGTLLNDSPLVAPAVVTSGEFDYLGSSSVCASQAEGAHGRFRSTVHKPDHLNRWNRIDHHFGQFVFKGCRCAIACALVYGFLERLDHVWMCMTQYQWSPR